MAGLTTSFANTMLALIFNATTSATLASAAGTATNFYVSLHTADPGTAGSQTTNEVAYTSYARVSLARSSGGWTVTSNSASPASNVTFPTCTGGSATATFWGIGLSSSGVGTLLMTGAISPSISIQNGVQPVLTTSSTVVEA